MSLGNIKKRFGSYALALCMFAALLAAFTPPVRAEEKRAQKNRDYMLENKHYRIECFNKTPEGCRRLLLLLQQHEEELQRLLSEQTEQEKQKAERLPRI